MSKTTKRVCVEMICFCFLLFALVTKNEASIACLKFIAMACLLLSPVAFFVSDKRKADIKKQLVFGVKTNLYTSMVQSFIVSCCGIPMYGLALLIGSIIACSGIYEYVSLKIEIVK